MKGVENRVSVGIVGDAGGVVLPPGFDPFDEELAHELGIVVLRVAVGPRAVVLVIPVAIVDDLVVVPGRNEGMALEGALEEPIATIPAPEMPEVLEGPGDVVAARQRDSPPLQIYGIAVAVLAGVLIDLVAEVDDVIDVRVGDVAIRGVVAVLEQLAVRDR